MHRALLVLEMNIFSDNLLVLASKCNDGSYRFFGRVVLCHDKQNTTRDELQEESEEAVLKSIPLKCF